MSKDEFLCVFLSVVLAGCVSEGAVRCACEVGTAMCEVSLDRVLELPEHEQ